MQGYPIGYGKYYCIVFNENEKLRDNATTREWVRQTTIDLQAPLRDLVVERFRTGTLPALTEPELRAFAFDTHARAYAQAGLANVVVVAPEMLPIIASIPAAEFDPGSPNFHASDSPRWRTALSLPRFGGDIECRGDCSLERDFEWLLPDAAHLQDREAEHIAFRVHLLHDLIVGSLPEIARPLIEEHLKIVALGIVPNLHSVSGHSLHPRFTLSVR